METSSSALLLVDLDLVCHQFPLVKGTGTNGRPDELIQDCGHACLHFICKKSEPYYRLLVNWIVSDKTVMVPPSLTSSQFSDQEIYCKIG